MIDLGMNGSNADATKTTSSKTGLILEGGAMRGLFTAGVLDILMENEITFDGTIGVSAGAGFGCNFKSRQIGRVIRYSKRFAKEKRFCSAWSFLTTGDLFGGEFCYHRIPDELDLFDCDTYKNNPMPFYVVCTDVMTGEPIYHQVDECDYVGMEWIRASSSMPAAANPVTIDGRVMLDGGVADSIPILHMEDIGYDRNVVILTQPKGFVKGRSAALPLIRTKLRQYPAIAWMMEERHNIYNYTLEYVAEREKQGKALAIYPPEKLPIGHVEHNPEKMQRVYDIGRETGEAYIELVKELIG